MAGLTKEQKAAKQIEDAAKALEAKVIELSGLDAEAYAALTDEQRSEFMARAQAIQEAETPAPKAKADDSHLIVMTKAGEKLKVHPSCVADHKRLGWVEA